MIVKDMKLVWQLMKNGHEIKKFIGTTIILMVFGIVMSCVSTDMMLGMCGAFIMMTAPMMLFQSFMGVNFLRVVQASPKARHLQTTVMTTVIVVLELVGYLSATLCLLIMVASGVMAIETVGLLCLLMTVFAVFTMLFYVVSYHFFMVCTVIFYLGFFGGFLQLEKLTNVLAKLQLAMPVSFAIGVAVIVLMWLAIRLLAGLLLKYPLDPKALGAAGKTIHE